MKTPPVTPLPISVELAREIRSARASATIPEVADEMLGRLVERIIDARVRPLVEALQRVDGWSATVQRYGADGLPADTAEQISDALKAAGAE
jgi:hypothetical protein